jgi:hypothetical protein
MSYPANHETLSDEMLLLRLATATATLVALPREFREDAAGKPVRRVLIKGLPPDLRERFTLWYERHRGRYGHKSIYQSVPEAVWLDWIVDLLMLGEVEAVCGGVGGDGRDGGRPGQEED